MDRALIAEKIESLRRCVRRVETNCPATVEDLAADPDAQDIVALNLTRAVQLCVDIAAHILADRDLPAPASMAESFDGLVASGILESSLGERLKGAVGFRKVVVHNYRAVNWSIVFRLCQERLRDFTDFAHAVSTRC